VSPVAAAEALARPAGADPGEAGFAHEPFDPFAADVDAFALQGGAHAG
jgi:hypothetical protein